MISPRLAALHEIADSGGDFPKRQNLAQDFIELLAGATQFLRSASNASKQLYDLRSPEKVCQHDRINVWA